MGSNKWRVISKVVLKKRVRRAHYRRNTWDGQNNWRHGNRLADSWRNLKNERHAAVVHAGKLAVHAEEYRLDADQLHLFYYTSPVGEGNNYTVAFGASLVLIAIIIVLNILTAVIGNMSKIKADR